IATLIVRLISHYLLHTTWPLKTIARTTGFTSVDTMIKFYQANTSQTPTQYRSAHQEVLTQITQEIKIVES
ncbi:MAG: helix-turn-helix domain-containing protein, partial [Tannerellaceae bacterium]|nr:helix-turn-helix domain-containing protein [Tannerellaceae bacterium]